MRYAILLTLPLATLAASSVPAQAPATVNVQLANFKYTPSDIVLDHGRAYVLHLANLSSGGHDFSAPDFFAASAIAASDRGLIQEGAVEVPGGEAREIHLTAPGPGRYKVKCTHTMHKMMGMSGTILVR